MGGPGSCRLGCSLCVPLVYVPADVQVINISMGIRGSYSCSFVCRSQFRQHHKGSIMLDFTDDVVEDSWATECVGLSESVQNTGAHFSFPSEWWLRVRQFVMQTKTQQRTLSTVQWRNQELNSTISIRWVDFSQEH